MGILRCRYEEITLSKHVSEFFERDSKHRDRSKSIIQLQLYWLHLIDKIFSVIKPCSPIFIPQPWDEHADTGTMKATSPPSRSSVLTQYRDSWSQVATHLYSCLHFPFSVLTHHQPSLLLVGTCPLSVPPLLFVADTSSWLSWR